MGTPKYAAGRRVASVGTGRLITVTTGAAQRITATSGTFMVMIQNNGPAPMAIGDSAMLMGSGDVVFPYANRQYEDVADGFNLWLRADSAATVVAWLDHYPE